MSLTAALPRGTWALERKRIPLKKMPPEAVSVGEPSPARRPWTRVVRRFRDGYFRSVVGCRTLCLSGYGPNNPHLCLVVATSDPADAPQGRDPPRGNQPAPLLARPRPRSGRWPLRIPRPRVVRLYGMRNWVEQSYKQAKNKLGWADFQVRKDRAIPKALGTGLLRLLFCGQAWFADHPAQPAAPDPPAVPTAARGATATRHRGRTSRQEFVAGGAASGAGLAGPVERAGALLASVVTSAAAPAAPTAA